MAGIISTALPSNRKIPLERLQHKKSLSKTSSTVHYDKEWMDADLAEIIGFESSLLQQY